MEGVKIYGLCLERLRHQINLARARGAAPGEPAVLESYNTGDIDEIIDILELYDIEHETPDALMEKLEDLAYSASLLVKEKIEFGFNGRGHLCIYWRPKD